MSRSTDSSSSLHHQETSSQSWESTTSRECRRELSSGSPGLFSLTSWSNDPRYFTRTNNRSSGSSKQVLHLQYPSDNFCSKVQWTSLEDLKTAQNDQELFSLFVDVQKNEGFVSSITDHDTLETFIETTILDISHSANVIKVIKFFLKTSLEDLGAATCKLNKFCRP